MTLLRRGTRFSWPLIILLTLLSGEILNVQSQDPQQQGGGNNPNPPAPPGQETPKGPPKLPHLLRINQGKVKLSPHAGIIEDVSKYGDISGACSVTSSPDNANTITLTYDKKAAGEGCSVYLVFGTEMESIDFTANLKLEGECKTKLEAAQCKDSDWNNAVEQSSTNSMPFTYSVTRSEIVNLKDGPTHGVQCPAAVTGQPADDTTCKANGGEYCMDKTFLEIGWSKCDNKLHALVHPVGEPKAGVGLKDAADSIEVKIESDVAKKWFTVGKDEYDVSKPEQGPFCVKPENIVKPTYWPIEEHDGIFILAFHLLPQAARRVHAWEEDTKTWAVMKKDDLDEEVSAPACVGQLSITFKDVIGLLAYGEEGLKPLPTPTPLTESTTTTMPSTTSDGTAASSDGSTTDTPTPGTGPSETTTNGTTTEGTAADGNKPMAPWLIALIVVGALALVAAVGVLIYCLCCRGKGEDDEEEAGEEEEDAEKGEAGDSKKEASGGDE